MRDINLEDTIYHRFTTRAFATGIPTTLAGTPVLSVYEENNLTQITAGVSITADYDSVTGLNQATIVATAANGYEAGKSYDIVITTGTVGGVSVVGEVVGSFTVEDSAIGLNATARAALEDQFDGTGLTGDDYPSTQAQVGAIGAATGGGLNFQMAGDNTGGALKGVTFVGVETGGTYASTEANDGAYHNITHSGNAIDIVYQVSVGGGRTISEFSYNGYLSSANDTITVQMYDFVGLDWETRATIAGQGGTIDVPRTFNALAKHTGTSGADVGLGFIRFVCTAQTSPDFFIDELVATGVSEGQSVGYDGGQVWIDTADGIAGTESYVNGVADNPVLTLADAVTIATNVGLHKFNASNESTITLASSSINQVYDGTGWNLALGGQDISGTTFTGANSVTGTSTAPTGESHFIECEFTNASIGNGHYKRCGFDGTLTLVEATDYFLVDCYSQIAGSGSPVIDMGAAIGASNVSIRRWSGGLTINNLAAGDVVTLDGIFGTVTLNGADATVEIRGISKAVTNNLTGSPTVNDDTLKTDIQEDWTDGGRLDVILDELTVQGDTNETKLDSNATAIAGLNDISVNDVLTTQMAEAYAADGTAPTLAQAIFLIQQTIGDFSITGTTLTAKKLDGSTTAATYTLDDASAPTSRTRTA